MITLELLNEKGYTLDTDELGRNVYYRGKVWEIARDQAMDGSWYEMVVGSRDPTGREQTDHEYHLYGLWG